MTISDIVINRKGRAGSNNAWHVYPTWSNSKTGERRFAMDHYRTLMLEWNEDMYGRKTVIYAGTGHGSVSDQGGMNQAFRALDLPFRMDRDNKGGGPRIISLVTAVA